ncbi:MAG TPA: PDZ domain-containing protein [Pseudogracilibacillus sp.]|nr:PDZ domain-containing protein [Pseudogracilibacillus sp.]
MWQQYVIEFLKGLARFFMNPLVYWMILLFMFTGYRRIKKERKDFGRKIYPLFEEGKVSWLIPFIASLFLSIITVVFGLYLNPEIILLLSIIVILWSITASTAFLSASYTLGVTFLITLVLPLIPVQYSVLGLDFQDIKVEYLTTLALLMGLFLFLEGFILKFTSNTSFPSMKMSKRGIRVGQQSLKKLVMVPFFVLLPAADMPFQFPLFPTFDIGGQVFMLAFIPFVFGYHYPVQSILPDQAASRLGKPTILLGVLVWLIAGFSFYYSIFSIVAIIIGLVGKEWITFSFKRKDRLSTSLYYPLEKGLKVMAVIPDSPAEKLHIHIGETILKVNGNDVKTDVEFHEALQNSGAFFKLSVLNADQEIRFVTSPLYEEDHYALGLIFSN